MLFALIAVDRKNSLQLRMATRETHFAWARETGKVVLGGPFLDGEGNMAGSLILFEADNPEAAQRWAEQDPYRTTGVFEGVEIKPWKPTYNPRNFAF